MGHPATPESAPAEPTAPTAKDAPAERAAKPRTDGQPVLPDRSTDETDVGWGDRPEPDDHDRLLRDRPPHWND